MENPKIKLYLNRTRTVFSYIALVLFIIIEAFFIIISPALLFADLLAAGDCFLAENPGSITLIDSLLFNLIFINGLQIILTFIQFFLSRKFFKIQIIALLAFIARQLTKNQSKNFGLVFYKIFCKTSMFFISTPFLL